MDVSFPIAFGQVVYSKYEEAFRLGLEAFSNPMRTNKFRRQLPHILGTLEFQRSPRREMILPQPYVPIAAHQPKNGEELPLETPKSEVIMVDAPQTEQDVGVTVQLQGASDNGGLHEDPQRLVQMPSSSLESKMPGVEGSVDVAGGQTISQRGCEDAPPRTGGRLEHARVGELDISWHVPNRWGSLPARQEVPRAQVPPFGTPSESQSEDRAWHSASSGSDLGSPKPEDFDPDVASSLQGMRIGLRGGEVTGLVPAKLQAAKEGGSSSLGYNSSIQNLGGDREIGTPLDSAADDGQLTGSAQEGNTLKRPGLHLAESLAGCLEGGLFDDEDFSTELERLKTTKDGSQGGTAPSTASHGASVTMDT